MQNELHCLLDSMKEDDNCLLVHRARSYYRRFRFPNPKLSQLLDEFCTKHPVVPSGSSYKSSMSWTVFTRCDLKLILSRVLVPHLSRSTRRPRSSISLYLVNYLGTKDNGITLRSCDSSHVSISSFSFTSPLPFTSVSLSVLLLSRSVLFVLSIG